MSLNSFRFLLILATLGAAGGVVSARETNNLAKPVGAVTDKVNSINEDSQPRLNAGNYNAPRNVFHDYSPNLPLPQPLYLGNQNAAAREAADKRKNWTLLTPEQIFGIQTPEQILGIKNPDSDKKLSLEEQFLLRESRPVAGGQKDGGATAPSWRDAPNPFDQNNNDSSLFSSGPLSQPAEQSQQNSASYFKQFFDAKKSDAPFAKKNTQAADWTSVFSQPRRPKTDVEQLADMERFRAMLNSDTPSDKPQTPQTTTMPTRFTTTPTPVADSFFQPQPIFNPAGRSVTLIKDDISRPVGIQPLSGLTRPESTAPETRPAWQAQLPPWLSDDPQPNNARRNF